MPPPVNGDRNSANGDGKLKSDSSDLDESNGTGGDLPRGAMAADRAPKAVSFLAVVHGQNGSFGRRGWSEIKAGDLKNRTLPMVQPNSGEIDGDENGLSFDLSSFDHRRSGCFQVTMTAGIWPASLKLQISTKLDRNSGWKRELDPGRSRGSGWAKQVNFSLSPAISRAPLSFLFWKLVPSFPFIEINFF